MSRQEDGIAAYFSAACALRSDSPAVRRPAVSMLLELARHATGPVRARAERALTEQFGPFVVSDGLPGCAAPIGVVEGCDGNCLSCVWLWGGQEAASFMPHAYGHLENSPGGSAGFLTLLHSMSR